MDKLVILAYNEAIEEEVMESLSMCALNNYTKITGVFGKGNTSGTHLGNEIWPGRNNLLLVAGPEVQTKQLLNCIRKLRQVLGKEGVKAFVLPIEELT
ncbi:MAG: hypothetical protein N2606_00460 [Candidatus Omnitrophica bacterium]|nr:hypothetical protein [Candidatus Omnitrophota bacterium]